MGLGERAIAPPHFLFLGAEIPPAVKISPAREDLSPSSGYTDQGNCSRFECE
ncbi:hypothetical protein SPLC1_S081910 [Arthrospira platensis C1]|nr:hypothetical protein SPLC1_S081910 [Arthrospira platensis C1]